jgi:peptidoglycan/LPS O-acetylase OafA/YrhL
VSESGEQVRRLGYQPGLDGLRGVAVLAVVAYHGGVSWAPGGFTGVDAFFVVSGYLITTLLVDEWVATGTISLRAFWARRVRRLFPALALLLVAVAAYVLVAAPDLLRRSIRNDGLATLAYVANWRLVLSHQSYFEQAAGVSPLRHTWSLAVEEQWYVVWPLVVLTGMALVARRARHQDGSRCGNGPERDVSTTSSVGRGGWLLLVAAGLCAAAALASAVWMAVLTRGDSDVSRAYYGTDTRAQSLLLGAALAFLLRWRSMRPTGPSRRASIVAAAAGLVGLVVGIGAVVRIDQGDRGLYRGGFLLVALAWAAVIVASLDDAPGPVRAVFSWRPLVWVGSISYGLYLWDWPAVVVLTPERTHLHGNVLVLVQILAAAAVAAASYALMEQPIRRGRWRERTWWRPTAAVPAVAVGVAVALVLAAIGAPVPSSTGGGFAAKATGAELVRISSRGSLDPGALPPPGTATTPPPPPKDRPLRVTVVGDSVGFSFVWFAPKIDGIALHSEAVVGCGVIPGDLQNGQVRRPPQEGCQTWEDHWRKAAAGNPDVAIVFLGAWEVHDAWVDGHRLRVGTQAWRRYLLGQVDTGLHLLTDHTTTRVGVMRVPCFDDRHPEPRGSAAERNDPTRVAAVNDVLADATARHPGRAVMVDYASFACPGSHFRTKVDGVTLRPDGIHVDRTSAVVAWRWLAPITQEIARRPVL